MYNNIGLATVRGSATSGHVQANRGYVRPSSQRYRTNKNVSREPSFHNNRNGRSFKNTVANADIQEHERKRRLESHLLELRERLEDEGRYTNEQIEEKVCVERKRQTRVWDEKERRKVEREKRLQSQQTEMLEQMESSKENGIAKKHPSGSTSKDEPSREREMKRARSSKK
mmetsp:Transcript_15349/g.21904  ORF Transcript_15349/g.21904 Transcript_15349/m.21904 type:complete len:171 (-) Transcript_15349:158-670(-)|eukprot:CAMPEP_0184857256 /NCGR_PEP_ID=MMETSP0580-20130426/2422_1 /TAXON_ID=1118495 /ORGANISM="Dactyliosolen fragilissimus" /LENGTH=170 /DNA_ID=CAMNT_0027352747 /DNA_START=60 /DNA_END=572 /DNA_ORIENTATION=-